MTWTAKYKCRMCGAVYRDCVANKGVASTISFEVAALGRSETASCLGVVSSTEVHYCDDGSFGISDFLGFQREDGEP